MDYDKMCYGKTVQKGMKLRATDMNKCLKRINIYKKLYFLMIK